MTTGLSISEQIRHIRHLGKQCGVSMARLLSDCDLKKGTLDSAYYRDTADKQTAAKLRRMRKLVEAYAKVREQN